MLGGHLASNDSSLLRQAKHQVHALHKLDVGFAGYASCLKATIAQRENRTKDAISLTQQGMEHFSTADDRRMLYAKYRLGVLIGGSKGEEITSAAGALLRQQGIANPERWVAMMLGEIIPSDR